MLCLCRCNSIKLDCNQPIVCVHSIWGWSYLISEALMAFFRVREVPGSIPGAALVPGTCGAERGFFAKKVLSLIACGSTKHGAGIARSSKNAGQDLSPTSFSPQPFGPRHHKRLRACVCCIPRARFPSSSSQARPCGSWLWPNFKLTALGGKLNVWLDLDD